MNYTPFLLKELVADEPPLTPKEALAAIRNFPPDSAFSASIRGGYEFRGWDNTVYMLANVVDAIKENTYVLVAANSKRKPKPPKPMQRPQAKRKTNPMANRFAAMARIARANSIKKAQRKAQQNDESRRT